MKVNDAVMSLALGCVFMGMFVGGCSYGEKRSTNSPIWKIDTLVDVVTVRDTIVQYRPQYREKTILDTMFVAVVDTVMVHDSVFLSLPRHQKSYQDEDYMVTISGYEPELDFIAVMPKSTTITKTVKVRKKTPWGIGVQGGYGFSNDGVSPYLGIGISYNFIRF